MTTSIFGKVAKKKAIGESKAILVEAEVIGPPASTFGISGKHKKRGKSELLEKDKAKRKGTVKFEEDKLEIEED